ncbi:hypothetical protein SAMN05216364_104215 [Porphyromonadaceae bacterium KHP3R9]|nr:hypothetical protein SAMN05216364_104215 [Porphyromonadaceae bacterium KHP3R9]
MGGYTNVLNLYLRKLFIYYVNNTLGARLENRTMNRLTTRHKRKNCHRTNGTFGFAR